MSTWLSQHQDNVALYTLCKTQSHTDIIYHCTQEFHSCYAHLLAISMSSILISMYTGILGKSTLKKDYVPEFIKERVSQLPESALTKKQVWLPRRWAQKELGYRINGVSWEIHVTLGEFVRSKTEADHNPCDQGLFLGAYVSVSCKRPRPRPGLHGSSVCKCRQTGNHLSLSVASVSGKNRFIL